MKKIGFFKRLFKYKRAVHVYGVILILSLVLSFVFIKTQSIAESIRNFISFLVGISGTAASLYSVFVSAKSDFDLNNERVAREKFFEKLDGKLGTILTNTGHIVNSINAVLNDKKYEDVEVCTNVQISDNSTKSDSKPDTDIEDSSDDKESWSPKSKSNESKVK